MRRKADTTLCLVQEPAKSILAGIALEFLEIDDLLRVEYFIDPDTTKAGATVYGFRLWRRRVEILRILLDGHHVECHYDWQNQLLPAQPVPNRPGCVYRPCLVSGGGCWGADIVDRLGFRDWMGLCEEFIVKRVLYLVRHQLKRHQFKLQEERRRLKIREMRRQGALAQLGERQAGSL
jgi:hypothetical protein